MNQLNSHSLFGLDLDRHRIGRSLMIRGIGAIYFIAFASWWSQVALLIGQNGLIPANNLLLFIEGRLDEPGISRFGTLPSLFWFFGASDFSFHVFSMIGCFLAILVMLGRFTGQALVGLWTLYLSFVNIGGVFMSFQWDILLLEAGFIAIFLCDWKRKTAWSDPPPLTVINRIALLFVWFLIAKMMFFSGWVKLAWATENNPEWWGEGTALAYHFMTQPIPSWTAWCAHQTPTWMLQLALFPMYGIEIFLPFAILFGRIGRLVAACGFILLMVLIMLTGNFTYFNWLTIVLCLPLITDRLWPLFFRNWLKFEPLGLTEPEERKPLLIRLGLITPVFLLLALLNLQTVLSDLHTAPKPFFKTDKVPAWLSSLAKSVRSYHLVSGYGLFRTMTTERPEIILEGSRDGVSWFEYDFQWKVDDLSDRPKFVAPHQPRVAWQFWFAALEGEFSYRSSNARWLESLVLKLLIGDRDTEKLLKNNPFPSEPPNFIRGRLFRYEFTTPEEKARTGDWWKRVVIREYLPEVSRPGT
ncbi:lipase maturation factor family protein [Verrucomicrobiales bacterium]|nr:lipase maturation factor family protein [Verrucomicrobiales bacterium]